MNTTVSKSFGLALLLAVGIIAVLVAMGAFTSQRAAAIITGATIEASPNTAGAQAKITITFNESHALDKSHTITVIFPPGFTVGDSVVNFTGTGDLGTKTATATSAVTATPLVRTLGIILGDVYEADESTVTEFKADKPITMVIDIGANPGDGVTLPAAGQHFVDFDTNVDADSVVVKPELTVVAATNGGDATEGTLTANPTGAGAAAAVTVTFRETADLEVRGTISIKLKDFGVPSTIPATSVLIRGIDSVGGVSNVSQTAEGVSVDGDTISIIIPDMIGGDVDNGLDGGKDTTVLFRQSAGITLPTAAKGYPAVITTDNTSADNPAKTTPDLVIKRELSLSPSSGAKGTEVTASGKGWGSNGPVMLWIDDGTGTLKLADGTLKGDDDKLRNGLEVILAENVAVSGGAFSATFTADFSDDTTIQARDANGDYIEVADGRTFTVKGSLSLDKDSVKVNEKLEITLSEYKAGTVHEVKIGGVVQEVPSDDNMVTADGKATFTISVKSDTPVGTQVVSVNAGGTAAADGETTTATVSVAAVPMTVSPTTAALGQEVTVSATGFTATTNADQPESIASVNVGGQPVDTDSNGDLVGDTDTDNNGNINISFAVPTAAGTGDVLIRITDTGNRVGEARINIPAATLTLSASESRRNSRVTATGTGFVANDSILLDYINDSGRVRSVGTARTDSVGAWSVQFVVPVDAGIGATGEVRATSSAKATGGAAISTKSADHKVPGATITLDPATAASGDSIKISGSSFPGYAGVDTLKIGGNELSAVGIQTNAEGFFSANVTVPQLPSGTHSVSVKISTQTISAQLVIPVDTTQTVEDVFADLIANESLQTIWRYDFDTRTWTSYTTDPETSFANDLFEVESSDILNINVSSEQTFSHQKGSSLFEGWNLITLN